MRIELRVASEEDLPIAARLLSSVYANGDPVTELPELDAHTRVFLGRVEGKDRFVAKVLDFATMRGSYGPMRTAGIAAVGVDPCARGEGIGLACLSELLRRLASEGYLLSSLWPFRESFYRKLGFTPCGWHWKITAPTNRIPFFDSPLEASEIDPSEFEQLRPCHEAWIRSFSGSPARSDGQWKKRFGKLTPRVFVFRGDAGIEAYLWARSAEFWGQLVVGELAYSTPVGYRSALAMIRSLCANQSSATWSEPPDSPFLAQFLDQGVKAERHRESMMRVLDVPGCLAVLPSAAPYSMQVHDPLLERNRSAWMIEPGTKGSLVRPSDQGEFEIRIDQLSSAVMGSPSMDELVRHGAISRCEASARAASHLASNQVFLADFF